MDKHRFIQHTPAASGEDIVEVTPEDAGWTYCGLRVLELRPDEPRTICTGASESFVLPLSATDVKVTVDGECFHLDGRTSVFSRVTDFMYVGKGSTATIASEFGGEIAIPSARTTRALPPKYGSAAEVSIETRGAGAASRQVTNFGSDTAWAHADKLMCVELLTPDGNWSSYPPHKHDRSPECPVNNEEIYYFRIGRAGSTDYDPIGFGIHRAYSGESGCGPVFDDNLVVHDGDIYLVGSGYHGPCVAAPGYTMYYLNVLAGPGGERSMAFCDDPSHHWVRGSWGSAIADPRCPMTTADGVVSRR